MARKTTRPPARRQAEPAPAPGPAPFQIDLGGGNGSEELDRAGEYLLLHKVREAGLLQAYLRMALHDHRMARAFDSGEWDFMLLVSRRTGEVQKVNL